MLISCTVYNLCPVQHISTGWASIPPPPEQTSEFCQFPNQLSHPADLLDAVERDDVGNIKSGKKCLPISQEVPPSEMECHSAYKAHLERVDKSVQNSVLRTSLDPAHLGRHTAVSASHSFNSLSTYWKSVVLNNTSSH